MKILKKNLNSKLSMGMSGDFKSAIENGATFVKLDQKSLVKVIFILVLLSILGIKSLVFKNTACCWRIILNVKI